MKDCELLIIGAGAAGLTAANCHPFGHKSHIFVSMQIISRFSCKISA